jgi:hypothetical protein
MLLREDVTVEGTKRGLGSGFDVYFVYLLHAQIIITKKTISCDYQAELAPHSTDTQPVRHLSHYPSPYTRPLSESLAGIG